MSSSKRDVLEPSNNSREESELAGSELEKDPGANPEYVLEASAKKEDTEFPDGGIRAWLVVFGAMCSTFSTFGFVNSWGTFQAYYEQVVLSSSSPSSIAWIGSVQYAIIFLPGLLAGRLFDIGYFRVMISSSSVLIVVATFLIPECKVYWQFLLCQGFAIGLGCGGIFSATVSVMAHWFKRRRGLAMGFVTSGAAIGGIFFPVVIRSLVQNIGFPWCMRTLGFVLTVTLGLANLTLKRRLPPLKGGLGGMFHRRLFSSVPYKVYCLAGFVAWLGMYTALTFLNSSAVFYGVSPGFAIYLTAIANASSGIARLLTGYLSDRLGSLNIIIPFTLVSAVMTYAWPFARDVASLVVVAIIYGFASGTYISILMNPIIAMGDASDVGLRVGVASTVLGLGALLGPPISGAIERSSGGFPAVGYYAGSIIILSAALMILSRQLLLDWKIRGQV
ncbi:monocarboxylate permease [Moniliophthora roreri MCA 2997]|uniref:Monocarboxylate permease n=2 Tax=Moniliophthora roreri TaxID=221103 RepID=V2WW69_MONRO|nr:monocarboxylate permease [Moniliophthora roreri MCA 2997]KAI3619794.1 monocarboxylate permease [Moniliophthora roreri]